MRDTPCVALGWPEVGNLSHITNDKAGKEKIQQTLLLPDSPKLEQLQFEHSPISDLSVPKVAQQLLAFPNNIAIGDLVLATDGAIVRGIGRITGEYRYEASSAFPHRRSIEWLSLKQWQQLNQEQVLLQGLQLASTLTNESTLRIRLDRLVHVFQESVSSIKLDHSTFKRLHREIDRLNNAYLPAITIIELLLEAKGISLDEGLPQMPLPGFLFDMNFFFQELLSRFLKENLQEYRVQDQYKIRGMMAYDPAHNPRKRQAPEPRPDYMILQQAEVVSILDAKYRDLWEHALPAHMLYQLAIYALSQSGKVDAAILYPTIQADAKESRIVLRDPLRQSTLAHVALRPVNLLHLDEVIASAENANTRRARMALAQWLAFGKGFE